MEISKLSYGLMKQGLKASSLRNDVISNNIANVNTKDFKRSMVSFEETLKQETDSTSLKVTNDRHINHEKSVGEITVVKDESTSMNANGNNVDIDQEMSNSAVNAMQYQVLVNSINSKFHKMSSVINGR